MQDYDDEILSDVEMPDSHRESEQITPEDCWTVIASYFSERGLVSQQVESFDEFIQNTIQEVCDADKGLVVQTEKEFSGGDGDVKVARM